MKTNLYHNLRLGLFPVVLGLTSVFMGGIVNRVMIVELDIPTSLVGLFFSLPLFVSPIRIWLGYRSDAYPIFGLRREPFIILGDLAASLGTIAVTLLILRIEIQSPAWMLGASLAFIGYGIGRSLSSNTFEALQADKFDGEARPKAVAFLKVAMFIGIIGGSVVLGNIFLTFSFEKLLRVVVGVGIISTVVTVISIVFQEPRRPETAVESQQARQFTFWYTFNTFIWPDRQIRLFFFFVMLTVIGTLAQDVILEPYAAFVLDMNVGQTTRLTAIWGTGTLLAMLASGGWLINRFGYQPVLKAGLWLGVLVFIGLIFSGFIVSISLFWTLVFLLGISTGLSAAAMLTAVIEFTTPARAGLLMGVWGLAHNFGQALGSLLSGTLIDLVRVLQGNVLTAYGFVFAVEAGMLLIALGLFRRIKIQEARVLAET